MKKIKFLFIALILSISFGCVANTLLAKEEDDTKDTTEETTQILELIDKYIEQLKDQIDVIDAKTKNAQSQKEFEYYPAIRLNIDTPFFGMSSVVENKLKVKKDISTADVASGYSIRDVIKDKIIRLPDTYLGAIVTSTKEYKIDKNMSLSSAKITLVKCIQFVSQVKSVSEYVDNQTNYIFRDYISQEKKNSINDLKNRAKKVTSQLEEVAQMLKKLEIMGVDITEYSNTYSNLSTKLNEIKTNSKNTLILDDELSELQKTSLSNESDVISLYKTVEKKYEESLINVDYGVVLKKLVDEYQTKKDTMEKYIGSATTSVTKGTEEIITKNYSVTSTSTLDYLKDTLKTAKAELSNYKAPEPVDETIEKAKTEEQIAQEKQEKIAENKEKINKYYETYAELVRREYKFYIDNTNMLLKDSNDKLNQIFAYLDSDIQIDNEIFDYTKYIYIDLPSNLSSYIGDNDIDSILELNKLNTSLKKEITNLSNYNINITKIYDKVLKEVSKS